MVIVLFAALLVPWFVDWNAYRTVVAEQIEKVIGAPVELRGAVDFTVLPMPTLTLEDVVVGAKDGHPVAQVERLEARVELLALLAAKIRIAEMTLVKPKLDVVIDEAGAINWRVSDASLAGFDPDSVVVDGLAIEAGDISVSDARTGASFRLQSITTTLVQASSLRGPWKVNGNLETLGGAVAFKISTGRREPGGDMRMVVDLQPAAPYLAGMLTLDGTLKSGRNDLFYEGDFAFRKFRPETEENPVGTEAAWRMAGSFRLDPRQLRVPSFTVNEGSGNTPFGISGAMSVNFGAAGQFAAEVTSQQIDLDRPLGEGGRAEVAAAISGLLAEMARLPVPPIAGRVGVSIPAIVVGGGVIQGLSFDAIPADRAWQIRDMSVRLPGRSVIAANGTVTTGAIPAFFGYVNVQSEQPAALTAWLGGANGPRLRVADLDISARIHVGEGEFDAQNIVAKLGGADARGWIFYEGRTAGQPRLRAELEADSVHLDDLTTLGGFFASGLGVGKERQTETIEISFRAARVDTGDVALNDVSIVGALAGDTLKFDEVRVGDIGGATFSIESGQLEALSTRPHGRISGRFDAAKLDGVASLAERFWPDTAVTRWLRQTASELVPISMFGTVMAGNPNGQGDDVAFDLTGSIGGSSLAASARVAGSPLAWRTAASEVSVVLENRAAAELARQFGLPALPIGATPPARLELAAKGIVEKGMQAHIAGDFAGTRLDINGTARLTNAGTDLDARFDLESADIDPLLLIAGQTLPGIGNGTPVSLSGSVAADAERVSLTLGERSRLRGRPIGGGLTVALDEDDRRLDGRLDLEAVDLAWLASLGLGVAPELSGDAATPWSTLPFGEPATAGLVGKLGLNVGRLAVGPRLAVDDAVLAVAFAPALLDLNLTRGRLNGGTAAGSLSIRNPAGDAAIKGRIAVSEADFGAMTWRAPGGPLIAGKTSLTADFEATGKTTSRLAASLTGSGQMILKDGRVRGFDPGLFATIVKESEDGRSFSSDEIAARFANSTGGGGIAFDRLAARLAIVTGAVGLHDISLKGDGVTLSGEATINLADLTVEGEFPLKADPPEDAAGGPVPQITFNVGGPLDEPTTTIDGAAFARYLAMQTLERFEQLQEEELERDRLDRLLRKYHEEAAAARAERPGMERQAEAATASEAPPPSQLPAQKPSGPLPRARP